MNDSTEQSDPTDLEAWTTELCAELGVDATVNVDQVLDLAAEAAHSIVRPAAPLTTFIAGIAAGTAGANKASMDNAITMSMALCQAKSQE